MSKPLDEEYLEWLYSQVADVSVTDPHQTYWKLFKYMNDRQAVWRVRNDDNRLADGKYLRTFFLRDAGIESVDPVWMDLECSFLELMVGISRRASYEDLAERDPRYWFWRLLQNIGLNRMSDDKRFLRRRVDQVIDRVLDRDYDRNGHGGFFPLKNPRRDQRGVELWYQMAAYINEAN